MKIVKVPRIYISGAITGLDANEVENRFNNAEKEIRKIFPSSIIVNPVKSCKGKWSGTWEKSVIWKTCMSICIKELVDCDIIYMIDGWQSSKGAVIEKRIANDFGMLVVSEEDIDKSIDLYYTHIKGELRNE